jgi:endonuclease/exonuclease/phosphatase family metal-dependent hydrolase
MYFNWLAVALLLLSYLAGKTPPSQFAVVAVFGLIYPILFFINLFFVAFWLLRKDARLLLSLLIILMGFPHIRDNFSFRTARKSSVKSGIKILSYNVQGFTRQNNAPFKPQVKADILSFLTKENPDVICLQEYSGNKSDLFQKNDYENAYFHSYYTQKGSKNTGLVIVSKYKILNSSFLKFSGYRTFGIFSDIVFQKDTLRLLNVHLASISLEQTDLDLLTSGPSPAWQKQNVRQHFSDIYHKLQKAFRLRERQVSLVLKTVKSSPYPVVLCGDFNDTPSSNAYHRVATLLTDAFTKRGFGLSATYAGPLPFLRIDYFFASPGLKIDSYKKYRIRFSDHFPISMKVRIDNGR